MSPGAFNQAELDAIDYYNSKNGIVVFAAGNYNSELEYFPGAYEGDWRRGNPSTSFEGRPGYL